MSDRTRPFASSEPPKPDPVSIRTARSRFGALVDEVAGGRCVVICRRSLPLAVLVSAERYEEFVETVRRDESLAAVLRASGVAIDAWTTTAVLGAVARLLEEGRG